MHNSLPLQPPRLWDPFNLIIIIVIIIFIINIVIIIIVVIIITASLSLISCVQVSEDLSSELSSVKAFYERALEQLSGSEKGKKVLEQQLNLAEQERKRLQAELDRLTQVGRRYVDFIFIYVFLQ